MAVRNMFHIILPGELLPQVLAPSTLVRRRDYADCVFLHSLGQLSAAEFRAGDNIASLPR